MSKVHRFVTNDFTVRIASVDCTEVVQEMQAIQNAMPLASIGVGRAMVASLLMASNLKSEQAVGLLFKGNGPIASVYAEASFEGSVRGYCPSPLYEAPQNEDYLNLGKALGSGTLSVASHKPFQRQPYHGTVSLVSGEVGDDIAHYLAQSHQIRSLVSLGVYLDTFGQVKAAGGILIEVMPGVEDEIVTRIQGNHDNHKLSISKMILDGAKPIDLIKPYLLGLTYTQIPHEQEIKYSCPCNADRVKGALSILGVDGLQEMIQDQKPTEVICQICGRKYQLSLEDLEILKDEIRKNSMH